MLQYLLGLSPTERHIHLFYHLLHLAGWHVPNVGPMYTLALLARCLTKTTNSLQNTVKTPES
jgi:hypothetical protein